MVYVIILVLQLIIIALFNTYVLDLSWSKKQVWFLVFIGLIPSLILLSYIGALSIFYFIAVLIVFAYRITSKKIVIFHIVMSLIFFVIIDNLSSLLLIRYFNQDVNVSTLPLLYPVFLLIFGALFAFLYKNIVEKILSRFMVSNALTYLLTFLCILIALFIYINIVAIDSSDFYENVKSNFLLFLLFFILLVLSLFVILFLAFQRYKIKNREEELKSFENYIESIEQINRDMRKFKHDYVNMLTALKTFIDDKNYEDLRTYFYDYILEMNDQENLNDQALMMLNNLKLDSLKGLFTTKIMKAQAQGIPFYVEVVEEVTDIPADPIELNRAVGILLDNAIEAASEAEDKEMRVAIIQMPEAILIVIYNTYDTSHNLKVHELFEEGFSTKGKHRGLGLSTLLERKEQLPNLNLRTKIHPPYFTQELEFRREKL